MTYSYKGLTDPAAIAAERSKDHWKTMAGMSGISPYSVGALPSDPAYRLGASVAMRDPDSGNLLPMGSALETNQGRRLNRATTPQQNSSNKIDEINRAAKQRSIEIHLQALSDTALILKSIKTHLKKGTFEDYLRANEQKCLKNLKDMIYKELRLGPAKSDSRNVPDEPIAAVLNRLNHHLNNGTLERALIDKTTDGLRRRCEWKAFLKNIPHRTQEQIQKSREKRYRFAINSASALINMSLFSGITIVFMSVACQNQCITANINLSFGSEAILQKDYKTNASFKVNDTCTIARLNVRQTPSENGTVIATLPFQTAVQIKEEKRNQDWHLLTAKYGNQTITGYSHGDFIGKCQL